MPANRLRLLLVDDEPIKCEVLKEALTDAGLDVQLAVNPLLAEPLLEKHQFDVIVTDIRMPGRDGISFLRDLKANSPDQAVIVMTAYGTVDSAVEAMKLGAFDYLQKPFSSEELILKLDRLAAYQGLQRENRQLRRQLSGRQAETELIGRSAAMREVLGRVHAVATSDSSILIEGESGTGKELVARLIHECSHRARGPFVPVSCAALPESLIEAELFGHEAGAFTGALRARAGRFESAAGGTVLLDDVDDVPLPIQAKLLRVLQERRVERVGASTSVPVDFRLLAATKCDLRAAASNGAFREDLYYRLAVVPVRLPPLRDRPEDVPLLAAHFVETHAQRYGRERMGLRPDAVTRLQAYSWPGNVRELAHVIEQCVVLSDKVQLTAADLPALVEPPAPADFLQLKLGQQTRVDLPSLVSELESRLIDWAMSRSGGNLARAAEMLGVPRTTLQYRVAKLRPDGEGREWAPRWQSDE